MTSKLTREERVQSLYGLKIGQVLNPSDIESIKMLARMALGAMDSEPVAEVYQAPNVGICAALGPSIRMLCPLEPGTKLYRHAQPAPVVDADDNFYSWFGREWAENYQHNQYTTAAKQMLGVMAESAWKAATERQRRKQSVSVPDVKIYEGVPYEVGRFKTHRDCYCDGWNACRAAMLQAGNSPAQSYCCPAQNSVSPAQNGIAPAQSPIDHGYRPECECSGCKATARICAELSVNSPANPDCWCRTCRPVVLNDMRFVVCPDCGNKRCPRANDHRNACTGSNEPGQEGSAYPDTTQEPKP